MDFKTFSSNELNGGIQYQEFFPNNQGVSIIKHSFSYGNRQGLYELAVLKGTKEKNDIDYTTPITDDVIGYLSDEEVNTYCEQISNLPKS